MYQRHIIDRLIVYLSYPQDIINTKEIYRFALTQVECTSYCLFSDCKQNITPLSLLAGRTVDNVYLSYPQDRNKTQVISLFALAQVECTS